MLKAAPVRDPGRRDASSARLHQRNGSRTLNLSVPRSPGHALAATALNKPGPVKSGPVTWMSLPRKGQLAILFFSRLFDFLQVASLQAYIFHQLRSFDPSLPDAHISAQAGILQGCYTAAQIATAIIWGKVADASWGGRKMVLLIGLLGTSVSCFGYGFSTTFAQAAFFRVLGGGINGTVGIIRTMIAEITKEKKYQSRAFLLLPLSFNVAALLGPGKMAPTDLEISSTDTS
jgi:MFS family permease